MCTEITIKTSSKIVCKQKKISNEKLRKTIKSKKRKSKKKIEKKRKEIMTLMKNDQQTGQLPLNEHKVPGAPQHDPVISSKEAKVKTDAPIP